MTAYTILHTARSGSNWLCYMLAETGVAGLARPLHCGLFVGYGDGIAQGFPTNIDQYLESQRTPNGVTGCKTDWGYLDLIDKALGPLGHAEVLDRFTHFIQMSRQDIVRQAVSRYVAGASNAFTSYAPAHDTFDYDSISYNYGKIHHHYQAIATMHARNEAFMDRTDRPTYRLDYETLKRRPVTEIRNILEFLGIEYDGPVKTRVATKKQKGDDVKAEFARQFRADMGKIDD